VQMPLVATAGVLYHRGQDPKEVLLDAAEHLEEVFYEVDHGESLEELIRLETRRFFKKRSGIKPAVLSVIMKE